MPAKAKAKAANSTAARFSGKPAQPNVSRKAPPGAREARLHEAAPRASSDTEAGTIASTELARSRARRTFEKLSRHHADAHCELDHRNAFELLVATVLSAQSTDVAVNKVTKDLFLRYGTPSALAQADPGVIQALLGRLGMFRQKTKSIIGLAQKLLRDHAGVVPQTLDELIQLPGVGRKTANVVLGVAFGRPEGVVVDTHVQRITQRLGWTRETGADKVERDLMQLFPRSDWDRLSHVLIFHGRRICGARRPDCAGCPVNTDCPSAFNAENVGRKPSRARGRTGARLL